MTIEEYSQLDQVTREYPELADIIEDVVESIGVESIDDVNSHGIDGGFSGFIYYTETVDFYRKHRKTINAMVKDMAEQLGEDPAVMVANFNCLKPCDDEDRWHIGACIYGGPLHDGTERIENALAWFAAEEVCRLFDQ